VRDFYGNRDLTKREWSVIALVAEGLNNGMIAKRVGISEMVVKNVLRSIYDKLGLWNRVELALWHETHFDPN
jgi:DNA-binding NarL/FixJ family response regulator